MQRKQIKIPNAILTADWHLREDTPTCRTEEEFQIAQWRKVDFVSALQKKYNCPVIHSGDLFNHWKPSPALLTKTIQHLPDNFYTIYGNHDLPQHNLELAYKCGINVLEEAKILEIMKETHWNQLPKEESILFPDYDIKMLVWHTMTYQGKRPWPGCIDPKAVKLLRKYPQYDLILTGHNHQTFVEEYEGRLLVNPGSLMRQEADKDKHKPCVFLYYADTNTVKKVYLPYAEGVVSREHIDKKQERDGRLEAFVNKLNNEWEGAVSFEENLERLISVNKIRTPVKEIISKAIDTI